LGSWLEFFARRRQAAAKAASKLNHPNIVTVHDTGTDAGLDFIVMELVAGKTISQLIGKKGAYVTRWGICGRA
jgi:serine/threonine-protein kinase